MEIYLKFWKLIFNVFYKNLSNIDHCFFSRLGGVSQGRYKSLNCGKGSKDENGAIEENLVAISRYYGLKKSILLLCIKHTLLMQ